MEESACSSKCGIFKVSSSLPRGQPRKTWNKVIRCDLKEGKSPKTWPKKFAKGNLAIGSLP